MQLYYSFFMSNWPLMPFQYDTLFLNSRLFQRKNAACSRFEYATLLLTYNYFDHRVTNAFTESINNQIKGIMRQGSGYSFSVLRARVLFQPSESKHSFKSSIGGVGGGVLGFMTPPELKDYGVLIDLPPECVHRPKLPDGLKYAPIPKEFK